MIAALALGAGIGLGLLLVLRGLRPPRRSLHVALAALQTLRDLPPDPPDPLDLPTAPDHSGWRHATWLLGRPTARLLHAFGLRVPMSTSDLRITQRSAERLLTEKVTLALLGLLLPPAMLGVLATLGVRLPTQGIAIAGLGLAVGGWLLPDVSLRQHAQQRRRDLRHSLGVVLDLTVIALAGGAGVEGALHDATQQGRDWATAQLRGVLDTARLRGEAPWTALGRLGEELGVPELTELAASVGLAGTEGAKVRSSLTAKAASLRAHQHADTEAQASAATERMALPTVVLLAAFLLFTGYPAVIQILTGV